MKKTTSIFLSISSSLLMFIYCSRPKAKEDLKKSKIAYYIQLQENKIHVLEKETKTLKMIFQGYDEGDYPHLIFKDIKTEDEYDFRFLSENNLSDMPILLPDNKSMFGFRPNNKLLNKSFDVLLEKKMVSDSDLEGNTFQSKEWVISSIKKINKLN